MEPILYFVLLAIVSIASFWFTGLVYGLSHKPAIYFPVSLATKMALCAVFGGLLLMGIGGVIFSTLVFNFEMSKRQDYKKWRTIISGLVISTFCTVTIYFSAFSLAWKVFD